MYCPNCGKKIPSKSKFCPMCGFNIKEFFDNSLSELEEDLEKNNIEEEIITENNIEEDVDSIQDKIIIEEKEDIITEKNNRNDLKKI